MANDEHVALLKQGVDAWKAWRDKNPDIRPDLSRADLREALLVEAFLGEADLQKADLSGADLGGADLGGADLRGADLSEAKLNEARLSEAKLSRANLSEAKLVRANLWRADLGGAGLSGVDFRGANLSGANLREAYLSGANLQRADLRGANLSGATLQFSTLVETDLTDADLTGCYIYGISAWRLKLDGAKQQSLVVTGADEPEITVDNIEVAQFIYLMLNNQKIRDVIDTITSKAVLILGRFTDERKAVLDALREELRKRNYLPIVFDFEKPISQTTDETITLLARMARFVIADLSDPKSILQELRGIVPDLPSVAVQPLILEPQEEPGMFDFFRRYSWFLQPYRYHSQKHLLANLEKSVVDPAEAKVLELRGTAPRTGGARDPAG
jgi:uncharacterized protein YjbI with pentapeptide repeats